MTDTANDTTADDLADREWRYVGARLIQKGMGTAWIDHTGTERLYGADRGDRSRFAIGAIYAVRCSEDGRRAATHGARLVRTDDDHHDYPRWVAEDRAAAAVQSEEAAVKAAKRSERGAIENMTLTEARQFITGGPWNQTAARTAIVLRALGVAGG